jgi:hypothetical protein
MAPCGTEAPSTNGASAAAATVFMADAKVKEISVSELIDARPLGRYQFALSGSASSWCYSMGSIRRPSDSSQHTLSKI